MAKDECPVDHAAWAAGGAATSASAGRAGTQGPGAPSMGPSACPIDHGNGGEGLPPLPNVPSSLSADREISSIPRAGGEGNWVYPSQQQFFSAMKRKNHDPEAEDMPSVIPIHNAVNEKAWGEVLRWEHGWGSERCGGPKLARFSGDSSKISPKARLNMWLFGATKPFDRHDWVVDRCGTQVEYVIDFYTGAPDPRVPERPSFYLDVRPKLNSLEGIKMRLWDLTGGLLGNGSKGAAGNASESASSSTGNNGSGSVTTS